MKLIIQSNDSDVTLPSALHSGSSSILNMLKNSPSITNTFEMCHGMKTLEVSNDHNLDTSLLHSYIDSESKS
eukprot:CAMPEP_0201578828 /NCGR_PEP_ID=MMETSP0190_2-20130828/25900_1 /ASSEMBLY_ACC=CAM_ASM_000263 /TAXON_ID=37353 /ORGANISM="Rosalina sp." /LENGTH=71 /DNA_ID=CAMNT_0048012433 /DNA_START=38 /DNA_END=249 /DNA_ORIENTATION=-